MYDFKEVAIGHGEKERKRLVIEFSRPNEAILGEFLMIDVHLLGNDIVKELEELLHRERESITGSGNRCGWEINRQTAIINDLFEDKGENVPTFPSCTVETRQLYELITMWLEKCRAYYGE